MTYHVSLARSAQKELDAVPHKDRERIAARIGALAENPRPPDAVAMQGGARGRCRIRVGDYRVIYEINDGALTVLVLKIGGRGDVYR